MTWAEIVKKYPEANFLQSPEWGKVNTDNGFKVLTEDFDGQGYALIIIKNAKRGRYMEIPCGPLIDWADNKVVQNVFDRLKKIAQAEKCVFVRLRPQLLSTPENLSVLNAKKCRKSPMHLAAENTVIINLEKSESELLANMRRQTRYEVRRAEKLQIAVINDNSEKIFREFYAVQQETARRQKFVAPTLKFLLSERKHFENHISIYVAKTAENQPLAYGLVIWSGNEADYYEAASTELNRNLPGSYALIWQIMKDMKKKGLKTLNLCGIAPKNQPNHRYAGVTTFKTGFGGEIVEYVSAHDLIINKIKYIKNWVVETARRKKRHL